MNRGLILVTTFVVLAACRSEQAEPTSNEASLPVQSQAADSPSPESIKPGDPGGLPDDRTPVSEGAIDPKSGQGAGQVMQRFGGLLEQRRFADAYRLWSDGGLASGQSEAEFTAAYDRYAEIHSEVGAPGDVEGAAGSAYVEIPFRLYGKSKNGEPFNLIGTATLRRINDIPGSTEEQRRWHIYRTELKPRG